MAGQAPQKPVASRWQYLLVHLYASEKPWSWPQTPAAGQCSLRTQKRCQVPEECPEGMEYVRQMCLRPKPTSSCQESVPPCKVTQDTKDDLRLQRNLKMHLFSVRALMPRARSPHQRMSDPPRCHLIL